MDASSSVVLGIDLGTSSVKAVAVDEAGQVLGESSRGYELDCPQEGWREISPALWWKATCDAVRELAARFGERVQAVGVTGQMHTLVPLDETGEPVRPALMWNDVRTAALVPELRRALFSVGENYLAGLVSTGSPAANLVWMKHNEPQAFARMASFVIGPDWIVYKLTGSVGTDFCEASTSSLFNLQTQGWSAGACTQLGLPQSIFPQVYGAGEVAGQVGEELASQLGVPAGVPVVRGTGDNPAAALSTGCLGQGRTVVSLGTSGVLMARRAAPNYEAKGKNILFSVDGSQVDCLVQGSVQSCGSTRAWLSGRLLGSSLDELDASVDPAKAGSGSLLFFPHIGGEKTLFGDASLRGAFTGLSLESSAADVNLAVMEGIAFGFKQLAESMDIALGAGEPVLVVGGGSKSDVWMQVLAEVLAVPVQRMEGQSGAGLGAALLARAALEGGLPELALKAGRVFGPTPAAAAAAKKYRTYLRMHDALKSLYAFSEA